MRNTRFYDEASTKSNDWGATSEHSVAGISFLPPGTTMNGPRYVKLLAEKLKIHMAMPNCTIFMQDGAPCHRSKVAKTFLTENRIKVVDWPGNSPDLNPVENLWTNMKNTVFEKHPSSAKDLVKVIKEVLVKEISEEFCRNLVHSMPQRLQEVIKTEGNPQNTNFWLKILKFGGYRIKKTITM